MATTVDVALEGFSARRERLLVARVRRLFSHYSFVVGFTLLLIVVVGAVAAGLLATHAPDAMNFRERFVAPGPGGLFGTDAYGRDVFSRVLYGGRISLWIGFGVVLLNAVFGILIGCLAAYYRRLDNILMRVMDGLMAFPAILLAIAISAVLGASLINVIIALTITYVPRTARVLRASVLVIRESEYVEAARAAGARDWRILASHVLPNSLAPLLVQLTFIFAYAVLAEATLSFLGMGAPPPTPTWGSIIAEGRDVLVEAPWICLFPGIAISMTVLGLNLVGDGLRDVLDPRLKVLS